MNYKKYIILFLLLCEFISLFLLTKSFSNKEIDKVKENSRIDKKIFSMFVEMDNGNYREYIDSTIFPEGYQINLLNSKCVDTKGNVINGILSGNKNNVTVTSNKTAYCYIYFDIDRPATEELLATVPEEQLWDSTLEDDGYRYVGTNPDNYICFGTTDQEECINNTDKYMYRIIGIFEDGEGKQHLKLIKKEALNTAYAWHSNKSTDTNWDASDLYKGLNGDYFLDNTTYSYMQDSAWNNLITTWEYTTTNTKSYENYVSSLEYGLGYHSNKIKNVYLSELGKTISSIETCYYEYDGNTTHTFASCNTSISSNIYLKISLMYVSDYLLSLGNISLDYYSILEKEKLKTGWMHLNNNDNQELSSTFIDAPSSNEWTMTTHGFSDDDYYRSHIITSEGNPGIWRNDIPHSTRPVFYLESNTKLDKGTGTIDNPYTIETSPNLREYCEEYNNINECIKNEENNIEEVSDLWNSTLEDDGIRFVGTNPNNYVCFGTTNTNECTSDTDKYMYRIIGIFEDEEGQQHLKLIKKEALNTAYAWHSDYLSDTNWKDSELFKGLNGSYFFTNSSYSYIQESNWNNKIALWNYIASNNKLSESSNQTYSNTIVMQNYLHEINKNNETITTGEWETIPAKISLMYVSDYQLSLGEIALNYKSSETSHYTSMKNGWLHISNTNTQAYYQYEWTMTRFGTYSNGSSRAWYIYSDGYIAHGYVHGTIYLSRPVFYLTENIKITSGKGSITEPFIIS